MESASATATTSVSASTTSFYAVRRGIVPGIYTSWEECKAQIDGFPGAQYKKFKLAQEAEVFMNTIQVGNSQNEINLESLSLEQKYAFYKYRAGSNLFITGPGGTGKSHLIKTIRQDLEQRSTKYAVCALTGCAAVLLNCFAKTIHSWSGIGLCQGEVHEIVDKAAKNRKANTNWKSTRVLIVDEVSMMSQKMFEVLDRIGQVIRKNPLRPFGGIQVIFIGDFYQLPPVGKRDEPETTRFCFESARWSATFPAESHIALKTMFRHKNPEFIKVLDEVRQGVLTPESAALLRARILEPTECDGIVPTKLFPRNADAERVNDTMYAKLTDAEHLYESKRLTRLSTYTETGTPIPTDLIVRTEALSPDEMKQQLDLFEENSKIVPKLRLKKGAVVMCLANLDTDSGICNGSQGIVVDFVGGTTVPVVKFLNGITMPISPKVYQHGDYPRLGIEQVPLRLAWAFTIHKSQGVTLDLAQMDLGSNIFEYGQSYVGLSRIRTLDGLYLSGFNPQKIKTNPRVAAFYEGIGVITEQMVIDAEERIKQEDSFRMPSGEKLSGEKLSGEKLSGEKLSGEKPFDPNVFIVRL
jgi:ATP-dependent DNA helicase PIF1